MCKLQFVISIIKLLDVFYSILLINCALPSFSKSPHFNLKEVWCLPGTDINTLSLSSTFRTVAKSLLKLGVVCLSDTSTVMV